MAKKELTTHERLVAAGLTPLRPDHSIFQMGAMVLFVSRRRKAPEPSATEAEATGQAEKPKR